LRPLKRGSGSMSRHDKNYLEIACLRAQNSHAKKMKVGAIIVKDGRIISDGYNGTPAGFPNDCEDYEVADPSIMITRPEVLHAEANAILKLTRSAESSEGATLYLTVPPCVECAKLIIQARIARVVYARPHKRDGLHLLERAGIGFEQLKID